MKRALFTGRSARLLAGAVGVFILLSAHRAAAFPYTAGTTNRVTVPGDTGAAYRLYLPTTYSTSAPPPLVVYFDPGGSHEYGMGCLRDACEQEGWALVCAEYLSNSGPANEDWMVRELIDHVRRFIPHDRRRFYLSGLSGGAWRSHSQARSYWNEITGLLLFGTWIGDYDDYTVFPDRMAMARVNGLSARGDIANETDDDLYYARSAVRVGTFHFNGGHEIGPTTSLVAALEWLTDDFQTIGHTYIPTNFEAAAAQHLNAAEAAMLAGDYSAALSNAVVILEDYPMSSHAREADALFLSIFTNAERRSEIEWVAASDEAAWKTSWMFMQRGLEYDSANRTQDKLAFYDMSILACPTNSRSLVETAALLLEDDTLRFTQWSTAADFIEQTLQLSPDHWRGYHVKSSLYAIYGNLQEAAPLLETARTLIGPDNGNNQVGQVYSAAGATLSDYQRALRNAPSLPGGDNLECMFHNIPASMQSGWVTILGDATIQTNASHNGLMSLELSGHPSMGFLNANETRTNTAVWVIAYIQPTHGLQDVEIPPLPEWIPAVYFVDADGMIRARDGADEIWQTFPAPPTFSTNEWNRVVMALDFASQTWDLSINEVEVFSNLAFTHPSSIFYGAAFIHTHTNPAYMDTIQFSLTAPGPDRDRDGMPDFWEIANGLDPEDFTDRLADPDGDGISNFEEYHLGLYPHTEDSVPPTFTKVSFETAGCIYGTRELEYSPVPFRRNRWLRDFLLVSQNNPAFSIVVASESTTQRWASPGTENVTFSIPSQAMLQEFQNSYRPAFLQGPLNGLYRLEFDTDASGFAINFLGLNDADGDGMADEYEEYYFGHPTAASPSGNMADDAYPLIEKYYNHLDVFSKQPYSPFDSISIPGTHNAWSVIRNDMQLVANNLWLGTMTLSTESEFKFAANRAWNVNWGDDTQTSTDLPVRGIAQQGAANIQVLNPNGERIILSLHDLTGAYACVPVSADADRDGMPDAWEVQTLGGTHDGALDDPDGDGHCNLLEYLLGTDPTQPDPTEYKQYNTIHLAGNFNGWNSSAMPMIYQGNYWWELDTTFSRYANAEFKFTANGSWDTNWGSATTTAKSLPREETLTRPGNNIKLSAPLEGRYRFRFNDIFGIFSLEPLPDFVMTGNTSFAASAHSIQLEWPGLQNRLYSVYLLPDLLTPTNRIHLGRFLTPPDRLHHHTLPIPTNHPVGTFQIQLDPPGTPFTP